MKKIILFIAALIIFGFLIFKYLTEPKDKKIVIPEGLRKEEIEAI